MIQNLLVLSLLAFLSSHSFAAQKSNALGARGAIPARAAGPAALPQNSPASVGVPSLPNAIPAVSAAAAAGMVAHPAQPAASAAQASEPQADSAHSPEAVTGAPVGLISLAQAKRGYERIVSAADARLIQERVDALKSAEPEALFDGARKGRGEVTASSASEDDARKAAASRALARASRQRGSASTESLLFLGSAGALSGGIVLLAKGELASGAQQLAAAGIVVLGALGMICAGARVRGDTVAARAVIFLVDGGTIAVGSLGLYLAGLPWTSALLWAGIPAGLANLGFYLRGQAKGRHPTDGALTAWLGAIAAQTLAATALFSAQLGPIGLLLGLGSGAAGLALALRAREEAIGAVAGLLSLFMIANLAARLGFVGVLLVGFWSQAQWALLPVLGGWSLMALSIALLGVGALKAR